MMFKTLDETRAKAQTVVVEDQPIVWDYIKSCIEDYCEIKAFCTSTKDAENAIKYIRPDFVWLDCYLGEFSENGEGIKNSGLQIASWIKAHFPQTKIFVFSASNEPIILKYCQNIGVEGIALSGKYISDKEIVRSGVKTVLDGNKWLSPQIVESIKMRNFEDITVFEFIVLTSLICGKSTNSIAEDLSTTRKQINNCVYRAQRKLCIDSECSREQFLELFKEKIRASFNSSEYYNLTEMVSVNSMIQNLIDPVLEKLSNSDNLARMKINTFVSADF